LNRGSIGPSRASKDAAGERRSSTAGVTYFGDVEGDNDEADRIRDSAGRLPDRLQVCKQEVTGSIPVGSTGNGGGRWHPRTAGSDVSGGIVEGASRVLTAAELPRRMRAWGSADAS
jgi:hypothetical protein